MGYRDLDPWDPLSAEPPAAAPTHPAGEDAEADAGERRPLSVRPGAGVTDPARRAGPLAWALVGLLCAVVAAGSAWRLRTAAEHPEPLVAGAASTPAPAVLPLDAGTAAPSVGRQGSPSVADPATPTVPAPATAAGPSIVTGPPDPERVRAPQQAVTAFLTAWARPALPPKEWLAGITRHATAAYAQALASVDPRNVPATTVISVTPESVTTDRATFLAVTDGPRVRVTATVQAGQWRIASAEPTSDTPSLTASGSGSAAGPASASASPPEPASGPSTGSRAASAPPRT